MGNETPVFLTDERRAVLEGNYEGEDNTRRAHKSNIRARSKTAISELIEVAESPHIDNSTIFDERQIAQLIGTIISPPHKTITPRWNFNGTDSEYREVYNDEIGLVWRLDHLLNGYTDTLLRTNHPGDPADYEEMIEDS